jgi:hypothetical protein
VWTGERLDFGALQQRMVHSAATIRRRLAPKQPASYVVFDLLAINQVDIRMMKLSERQKRLSALAERWRPSLQLSPVTDDPDEAWEWLDAFSYSGVEGLVVKGAATSRVGGSGSRSILLGSGVQVSGPHQCSAWSRGRRWRSAHVRHVSCMKAVGHRRALRVFTSTPRWSCGDGEGRHPR